MNSYRSQQGSVRSLQLKFLYFLTDPVRQIKFANEIGKTLPGPVMQTVEIFATPFQFFKQGRSVRYFEGRINDNRKILSVHWNKEINKILSFRLFISITYNYDPIDCCLFVFEIAAIIIWLNNPSKLVYRVIVERLDWPHNFQRISM